MGILDRLLRRDDDGDVVLSPFTPDQVRPELSSLIEALTALIDSMETPESPLSNPGWRGRLRDLHSSRGDLRMLARREFSRDDLFEVLTCVRPIYRGTPPKEFARLEPLNDQVIAAIERVHDAAAVAPGAPQGRAS